MDEISALLGQIRAGDAEARNSLFSLTYDELRKLARARLREGGRSTCLNTTSLVHESYLRYIGAGALRAEDRRAFFAYASQVMRSVVIDSVRERQAQRRGGGVPELTLDTGVGDAMAGGSEADVLRVHEALLALEATEPRLAKVVEMRYFGGYTEAETAEALSVTERTVRRDWDKARMLLAALLSS